MEAGRELREADFDDLDFSLTELGLLGVSVSILRCAALRSWRFWSRSATWRSISA